MFSPVRQGKISPVLGVLGVPPAASFLLLLAKRMPAETQKKATRPRKSLFDGSTSHQKGWLPLAAILFDELIPPPGP